MSIYRITYTDPKLESDTVEAESYGLDFDGDFFEFLCPDKKRVITVAAREVLSIRRLDPTHNTNVTIHHPVCDAAEIERRVDQKIRRRNATGL